MSTILERAKQIRYDTEYRKTDCENRSWVKLGAFWFDEMKECIPELIAEVEAKNDMIEKMKTLMRSDDGVCLGCAAKLMEIERLRGLMDVVENTSRLRGNRLEEQIEALVIQKSAKDTRIKVLDAEDERWKSAYHRERELCPLPDSDCSRVRDRDARIKELEAELMQKGLIAGKLADELSSLKSYIKRLEAVFLRSNAAMRYYQEGNRGPWPQLGEKFKESYQKKAREALERIKEGRGSGAVGEI